MSERSMDGFWRDGAHVLAARVYHEDTDFTGIAYHGAYLRFAERGRTDFLYGVGLDHAELQRGDAPLALVVARMEMEFFAGARIGERLEIVTRVASSSGARVTFLQEIFRGDEGVLLWRGRVVIAAVSPAGRAVRLPLELRSALERDWSLPSA